jgi:cytoskeleton protein RodZ
MSDTPPIQFNTPDEGNRGAGDMLRLAREAQGLSLEALAMILKVAPTKLLALEEGRLEQLPDANYVRALAQTICRALKIDATPVLAALPAARPNPLGSERPSLNQPFKENRLAPKMFERTGHFDLSEFLSVKWLAPLALLAAAALVYSLPDTITWPAWLHLSAAPSAPAAPLSQVAPAASDVDADATAGVPLGETSVVQAASEPLFGSSGALGIPEASAIVAAPATSSPQLTASQLQTTTQTMSTHPGLEPGRKASEVASAPAKDEGLAPPVVLRTSEDTWVEIVDGSGGKRLSRLVKAEETLSIGGVAPWSVRIGNVRGVQLTLRGEPVDLSSYVRSNVARLELK